MEGTSVPRQMLPAKIQELMARDTRCCWFDSRHPVFRRTRSKLGWGPREPQPRVAPAAARLPGLPWPKKLPKFLLPLVLFFCACEQPLSNRDAGAIGGGALGAGLGAIIGNQVGSTGGGIAIGAAVGALTGAAVGDQLDTNERRFDEADKRLALQDKELEENRRIISELRASGLDVRDTPRGLVINLPDVLFEFGKASLTDGARSTIHEISSAIHNAPGRRVSVEGHTDSVGTLSYNQSLSENRARSVSDALIRDGVPRSRIASVRGYGESKPISTNYSDSGRARNRRVEVVIERR